MNCRCTRCSNHVKVAGLHWRKVSNSIKCECGGNIEIIIAMPRDGQPTVHFNRNNESFELIGTTYVPMNYKNKNNAERTTGSSQQGTD